MRKTLHIFLICIFFGVSYAHAEEVVKYSGSEFQGCHPIGNTSVFLNNPNDYSTIKPGYIYLPNGCKSLPEGRKKVVNGQVVLKTQAEIDAEDAQALLDAKTALLTTSKNHLTNDTPDAKAMRNAFRVVMASLIETRAKVNEVINKGNIPNTSTLPNRTWAQVVGATKAQIEAENDPNS